MISFYDIDGRMGLKNVWDLLDWGKHIQIVSRIQARIVKAVKNGKKRPLGIPAMHDRVEQALDLLGLDPVSETTADHHSYGFRKVRSVQDAMGAIYNALRRKGSADWILEADIKGCFDHIDHKWLNENIPMNKKKLKQWLKCGYLEKRTFNPSIEGTPQAASSHQHLLILHLMVFKASLQTTSGKLTRFILSGMRMISL